MGVILLYVGWRVVVVVAWGGCERERAGFGGGEWLMGWSDLLCMCRISNVRREM